MGVEIKSEDEAMSRLLQHWANVFRAKGIDHAEALGIASKYTKSFPELCWTMDFGQFASMLALKLDSASGPDGIPFSALRTDGPVLCSLLYACYRDWCLGNLLPTTLTYSWPRANLHMAKKMGAAERQRTGGLFQAATLLPNYFQALPLGV